MSIDDFMRMMQAPGSLDRDQLPEIQELVDTFPYFHSGHMLLLKSLHNMGHIRYNTQLRDSAVYIPDRKLLYHLIHDVAFAPAKEKEEVTEKKDVKETMPAGKKTGKSIKEEGTGDEKVKPSFPEREPAGETVSPEGIRSKEELLKEIQSRLKEIGKGEKYNSGDDTSGSQEDASSGSNPVLTDDELFILEEKAEGVRDDLQAVDTRLNEMSVVPDDNLLDIDQDEEGKPEKTPPPEQESPQTPRTKKKTLENVESLHIESFTGWLDYFQHDDHVDIRRKEDQPGPDPSPENRLIDDFLARQPRIVPRHPDDVPQEDIAGDSVKESGFFSETLAKIYLSQGYYTKAIYTYEKLRLKYPEKSSYFASQIEMIRKRLRDQTQN